MSFMDWSSKRVPGRSVDLVLGILVLVNGCTSNNKVTDERCTELRDHLVDLRLASLTSINSHPTVPTVGSNHPEAASAPPINVAAYRAAFNQTLGETFASNCLKNVSASQLQCALAATDSASVNDCLAKSAKE